jgi:hypothetical protein
MRFYIDEQTKQEIEAKIEELHKEWKGKVGYNMVLYQIDMLKQILSSSTILPVKRHWYGIIDVVITDVLEKYPKGVIIST